MFVEIGSDKGEEMTKFINDLEDCDSKKLIDELSLEYWTRQTKNKASRNRL